ncbi:MAG: 2Fe-2S iron-sulfur cluster-binding protein [Acidimicrobiales bacterium]
MPTDRALQFVVDGDQMSVPDDGASLLEVLRDRLGIRSPKDGCSPQGQCGCCTVLVDGQARVACVTPARRVAGREITTLDGMDEATRAEWADAFTACGASQCGFCTPGIIVRLESLRRRDGDLTDRTSVDRALAAHLCRCTGWNSIREAAIVVSGGDLARGDQSGGGPARDLEAASLRAAIEGRGPQRVAADVALGAGGFADDSAPLDALVAVPDGAGGWSVAETLAAARALSGKIQGRRTTVPPAPPLEVPPGDWAVTLATSWVEPAYLEVDASWCEPGGEPASPLANGGAFGGKSTSPLPEVARRLADEHGRAVRALWAREDVVREGPKRPPVSAGLDADGGGIVRVVETPGVAATIAAVLPAVTVEPLTVAGPPTSLHLRAAGLAEAHALASALAGRPLPFRTVDGAVAEAEATDGRIVVRVSCGDPLDEIVLRSYCVGAAHMAWSMVTSESLSVAPDGTIGDLTVRSFGIVRSADMPPVDVEILPSDGRPVNGSDAVFVAVTSAAWAARGFGPTWPTG